MDAIIVRLDNGNIIENGFYKSLITKELDIILEPNPFPTLCVLRSLVFRERFNFLFSTKLKKYIQDYLTSTNNALKQLMDIQLSHYDKIVLKEKALLREIKEQILTEN